MLSASPHGNWLNSNSAWHQCWLVRFLQEEVGKAMSLTNRLKLGGETLVLIGSREEAELCPNRFLNRFG